jgi:hypothetical protein
MSGRCLQITCVLVLAATWTLHGEEQGSGTLRGRFVYDGEPPVPKMFMGRIDESLLVQADNRGIANVVVWLHERETPVHPQHQKLLEAEIPLDLKGNRFGPHVQTLIAGQHLQIANLDPISHYINFDSVRNPHLKEFIPVSAKHKVQFARSEVIPFQMMCSVRPWMRGYILVLDHPYVAVSNANGEFCIPEIPQGEWTFRVWHESSGFIQKVKRDDRNVDWPKGRFKVDVTPNKVSDLGEILISEDAFK